MVSGTDASDLTGQPSNRRKLIVVVHVDVVGYSRLIGLDDIGTLDRMRRLRREVIDPAIAAYGGRIVNTGGDALLMVFDSVDGAVRSALRVQEQVSVVDHDLPPDRAIRFRIGINVGDVIPDGTDVHGNVVNVAARLQAECSPGGICVSRTVHDHMHGRPDIAFEALGTLNLKNIAHPVEAFMLRVATTVGTLQSVEQPLLHGAGVLPLPDKPSIAVLPFTNMSGNPEQEYFADGMAEDIITELSRLPWLFVIARSSSFTYKGQAADIRSVARELGVRYVLEGSVRRAGDRMRATAQLVDASSGAHIWAERYDRTITDLFKVQDEITEAVSVAIGGVVSDIEQQRALRRPPASLSAWEAYQRGLWHFSHMTPGEAERAIEMFRRSETLDPQFAPALTAWATVLLYQASGLSEVPFDATIQQAEAIARRAVEVAPHDGDARGNLAAAQILRGNFTDADIHISQARALNPNSPVTLRQLGMLLVFTGRGQEGREVLQDYLRRNPRDANGVVAMVQVALSFYLEGRYLEALAEARRASGHLPSHALSYRWAAAALGQLGRQSEAAVMLLRAQEVSPTAFGFFVRGCPPWMRLEDHEHMLDGLRKAGWQG
jgi:adenylate cyclase